jgi:putative membrane protein
MSLRALALDWRIDLSAAAALASLVAVGLLYLAGVAWGNRHDRRGRRWPMQHTLCFLAGLTVAAIDLSSGIGTEADSWLSAHMLEHMILWVVVAPLLAAAAPVRLALFASSPRARRRLARCLHSRAMAGLTSPVGSVALFSVLILLTHVPAVYGVVLSNEVLHEAEHGLYLVGALLIWAPIIGADPLPHQPGPRGQFACMLACMLPMGLIALWLATASTSLYGQHVAGVGSAALQDQRLAATIMWVGGLPALALPGFAGAWLPLLRNHPHTPPRRAHT